MSRRLFDDGEDFIDKVFKIFPVLWIAGALVSLAVTGVVIWGVIELVQWVTSK